MDTSTSPKPPSCPVQLHSAIPHLKLTMIPLKTLKFSLHQTDLCYWRVLSKSSHRWLSAWSSIISSLLLIIVILNHHHHHHLQFNSLLSFYLIISFNLPSALPFLPFIVPQPTPAAANPVVVVAPSEDVQTSDQENSDAVVVVAPSSSEVAASDPSSEQAIPSAVLVEPLPEAPAVAPTLEPSSSSSN